MRYAYAGGQAMGRIMQVFTTTVSVIFMAFALPVAADPLTGLKEIVLRNGATEEIVIGQVEFLPDGSGATYSISWNDAVFTDHFLSMRPFKCIEGAEKNWCQVPYPYEIRRHVDAEDLTDLEYDLLFIWKGSSEYGINMWNGVYYRLALDGDKITGQLHEIDMDTLSAPPPDGVLRPVRAQDLHESEADSHWLPEVVIR